MPLASISGMPCQNDFLGKGGSEAANYILCNSFITSSSNFLNQGFSLAA
jgi:hypothetical protein